MLEQNCVACSTWDIIIKEKIHHCIRAWYHIIGSTSVDLEKLEDRSCKLSLKTTNVTPISRLNYLVQSTEDVKEKTKLAKYYKT